MGEDGGAQGNTDKLAQSCQRRKECWCWLALLVYPIKNENEAFPAVQEDLELGHERGEILTSAINFRICRAIAASPQGVSNGGDGSFEEVSSRDAFL